MGKEILQFSRRDFLIASRVVGLSVLLSACGVEISQTPEFKGEEAGGLIEVDTGDRIAPLNTRQLGQLINEQWLLTPVSGWQLDAEAVDPHLIAESREVWLAGLSDILSIGFLESDPNLWGAIFQSKNAHKVIGRSGAVSSHHFSEDLIKMAVFYANEVMIEPPPPPPKIYQVMLIHPEKNESEAVIIAQHGLYFWQVVRKTAQLEDNGLLVYYPLELEGEEIESGNKDELAKEFGLLKKDTEVVKVGKGYKLRLFYSPKGKLEWGLMVGEPEDQILMTQPSWGSRIENMPNWDRVEDKNLWLDVTEYYRSKQEFYLLGMNNIEFLIKLLDKMDEFILPQDPLLTQKLDQVDYLQQLEANQNWAMVMPGDALDVWDDYGDAAEKVGWLHPGGVLPFQIEQRNFKHYLKVGNDKGGKAFWLKLTPNVRQRLILINGENFIELAKVLATLQGKTTPLNQGLASRLETGWVSLEQRVERVNIFEQYLVQLEMELGNDSK